ncbi:MFS transporter [Actinoplanes awajinensis]|uniref:Fucose permease n=1 Tax=Actinoplanes awajinensis subsp. mycoplanecinus TaxID=135947 RepID=A0A101JS20_9ACTN|nr:MFS transporter [Actinoplanes awajinensis]KUL31924.1 fucose permease [Actinoplanes awajinensis subsp. mycoplanecinus]
MPSTVATGPTRQARQARAAVAALFLTNGAVFFNVVPRYPQIKADLDLSNALLGASLAAFPVGALLAGLLAGAAIRRFGSARVASFGIVLTAAATLLIPFAPHWIVFAAVLFVVGALDSIVDVAQNGHGLRVQRLYGRSIVNSLHGVWSIGAVLGGLMGAAAAGLDLPLAVHLTISATLFSLVALVAYRFTLPGPEDAERTPEAVTAPIGEPAAATPPSPPADPLFAAAPSSASADPLFVAAPSSASADHRAATVASSAAPAEPRAGWRSFGGAALRMLAALGVLAACGALVEDAGSSWGALYLTDLHASAATAGLAVVALQVAMTAGRLTGDRVVDRFGQRTVVRAGGALAAVGMGAALAVPSVPAALVGFALAGLGVATLVPAAMHTADELPGLPPGTGLTIVSWLLRGGFLLSPPIVGVVADLTSLRVGLLTVVLAGVLTAILARVLVNRPPAHS